MGRQRSLSQCDYSIQRSKLLWHVSQQRRCDPDLRSKNEHQAVQGRRSPIPLAWSNRPFQLVNAIPNRKSNRNRGRNEQARNRGNQRKGHRLQRAPEAT